MAVSTIFTRIIEGEIPSHRVYEDERTFAFLDVNPRQMGHTLVVPKVAVDSLFELEADDYSALWATCRTMAKAIERATECARVFVVVAGFEVPHAHVHLIPTNLLSDFPFPPVDIAAQAALASTADLLRATLGE